VKSVEPGFLQLEVTAGRVTLDMREVKAGTVLQIDTPNASLTTQRDGYYRIDTSDNGDRVTVRRAGQARVTPAGGRPIDLATGESVLIGGSGDAELEIGAAPGFDDWN